MIPQDQSALPGTLLVVWWLLAVGSGSGGYARMTGFMNSWIGRLILFGYTWALIHHTLGGIRHLIWDTGRLFDKHVSTQLPYAITVAAELTKAGEIGRIGGAPYLHTLVAGVPTAANASYYSRIVAERAILRRLVEAGTRRWWRGRACRSARPARPRRPRRRRTARPRAPRAPAGPPPRIGRPRRGAAAAAPTAPA